MGVFLTDLTFYSHILWPINMFILGFASIGVFIEKGKWKNIIKNVLSFIVLLLPICLPFFGHYPYYFLALNMIYVVFFMFILSEILHFLFRPSYINLDIILASACGYFLLIEVSVFLMQAFQYFDPNSFKGINVRNNAETFMDLVYFCSVTITSIGFGDITPNTHYTKLITSLFGIAGQFYSVILVGILISKFSSRNEQLEKSLERYKEIANKNK